MKGKPGKQTEGSRKRKTAQAKAQGSERVHPSRSIKDSPCGQSSGDEMGNGKKRDQETEGSRCQKPVSCDKGLAIILRALGSH